jgi:hypothetical protein
MEYKTGANLNHRARNCITLRLRLHQNDAAPAPQHRFLKGSLQNKKIYVPVLKYDLSFVNKWELSSFPYIFILFNRYGTGMHVKNVYELLKYL